MSTTMTICVAVLLTMIVVIPVTWFLATAHRKKNYESKIGSAEEKSREIIDEALKTAEDRRDKEARSSPGSQGRVHPDEE